MAKEKWGLTDEKRNATHGGIIRGWHLRGDGLKEQGHLAISLYFIFAKT